MSNGDDKGEGGGGGGGMPPEEGGNGAESLSLSSGRPAVAAAPGKMVFILLLAALCVGIVVKSLFFGGETKAPPVKHEKEKVQRASSDMISASDLPKPPSENLNIPPPPPPAPPVLPVAPPPPLPVPAVTSKGPNDEQQKARIHSAMLIGGNAHFTKSEPSKRSKAGTGSGDPNLAFAEGVAESDADTVEAKKMGNLTNIIGQGKLLHAVLESAIDTDLPGPIRAVVSHDIYAEAGRAVLIPKGSRLIGTYNAKILHGQSRVFIIWTRVMRPDGIDVMINSPGVDSLGQAGMGGDVDNHYAEMYATAGLTSLLQLGFAGVSDALFGSQTSSSTTGSAGTTTSTTGSAGSAAATQAVQSMGTVGQTIVGTATNIQPTIHVDQGTPIMVFVNKDLIFPAQITNTTHNLE